MRRCLHGHLRQGTSLGTASASLSVPRTVGPFGGGLQSAWHGLPPVASAPSESRPHRHPPSQHTSTTVRRQGHIGALGAHSSVTGFAVRHPQLRTLLRRHHGQRLDQCRSPRGPPFKETIKAIDDNSVAGSPGWVAHRRARPPLGRSLRFAPRALRAPPTSPGPSCSRLPADLQTRKRGPSEPSLASAKKGLSYPPSQNGSAVVGPGPPYRAAARRPIGIHSL